MDVCCHRECFFKNIIQRGKERERERKEREIRRKRLSERERERQTERERERERGERVHSVDVLYGDMLFGRLLSRSRISGYCTPPALTQRE